MKSTIDFVEALKRLNEQVEQAMPGVKEKYDQDVTGWRAIYVELSGVQTALGQILDEYDGDVPVEDRPLSAGERSIYGAAEGWWERTQEMIIERNTASFWRQ